MLEEDDVFLFQMQRKQFPIQLALGKLATRVKDKSQGQSLSVYGIHLDQPFFSCGQLYVALGQI